MTCDYIPMRQRNHPPEAPPDAFPLTHKPDASKRLQRNEGAISLVLAKIKANLIEAIETQGFHGRLRFEIEVVDEDLMIFENSHGQRFKLK